MVNIIEEKTCRDPDLCSVLLVAVAGCLVLDGEIFRLTTFIHLFKVTLLISVDKSQKVLFVNCQLKKAILKMLKS